MHVDKPEKITDFKWLNIFHTRWQNRDKQGEWFFASRRSEPHFGPGEHEADAVLIVPIYVSPAGERKLVVIREFRIPINDYEFGFPAGLKNPDESVIQCASRELKEETGLQLTVIKRVSPVIYSSTGLSDESVQMVFTECIGDISDSGLEPTEEISVHLLDLEGIQKLCTNYGAKQSSKMWPVLYMFANMGTLEMKS